MDELEQTNQATAEILPEKQPGYSEEEKLFRLQEIRLSAVNFALQANRSEQETDAAKLVKDAVLIENYILSGSTEDNGLDSD